MDHPLLPPPEQLAAPLPDLVPSQRPAPEEEALPSDAPALTTAARRLEYATVLWHVGEAGIGILVGLAAGSVAMFGFGLSAVVELVASLVVIWHLGGAGRERLAMRLLAGCFVLVGAFLAGDAVRALLSGHHASPGWGSVTVMLFSVAMMYALSFSKLRVGRRLGSRPLQANALMGIVDGTVGVAVLAALALNAGFGWWWADPIAAGLVSVFALRAGWETWKDA